MKAPENIINVENLSELTDDLLRDLNTGSWGAYEKPNWIEPVFSGRTIRKWILSKTINRIEPVLAEGQQLEPTGLTNPKELLVILPHNIISNSGTIIATFNSQVKVYTEKILYYTKLMSRSSVLDINWEENSDETIALTLDLENMNSGEARSIKLTLIENDGNFHYYVIIKNHTISKVLNSYLYDYTSSFQLLKTVTYNSNSYNIYHFYRDTDSIGATLTINF